MMEEVDAAPSPSDPSTSEDDERDEDTSRHEADETWREELVMDSQLYTSQEDKDIVMYLIKTRKYTLVKGNDVWMSMAKKIKKPRTWQSLKNRYLRYIVPNLREYNFTGEICNKIRLGLNPVAPATKKTV